MRTVLTRFSISSMRGEGTGLKENALPRIALTRISLRTLPKRFLFEIRKLNSFYILCLC